MTGNLPSFPLSLNRLYLGSPNNTGNHFTGSLVLYKPSYVYINDNWISDAVIQDTSKLVSPFCDLSNNPLLGSPHISGLTMCTTNGLYYNTTSSYLKATPTIMTATNKVVHIRTRRIITKVLGNTEISNGTTTLKITSSCINTTSSTVQVTTLIQPQPTSVNVSARMVLSVLINSIILSMVIYKTPFMREIRSMRKMWEDKTDFRSDLL